MLKLPAFMTKKFATGETVTIFGDSEKFWYFYLIPGFPTVRIDPNGNPIFQLIKYKLSDESREENKELPRGGGYMVFDSELKVKKEQQDEIEKDLTTWVRKEWERLKALPNDAVRTLTIGAMFNDTIGSQWAGKDMKADRVPIRRPART